MRRARIIGEAIKSVRKGKGQTTTLLEMSILQKVVIRTRKNVEDRVV